MRIAKNLFIKRPKKWQYILSIVMEIPVFIWFIRNIPQVLWQWGGNDRLYNNFFYILYNK